MLNKKVLNVSYKDKDKVKQLGAKWDPQQKVWFIPPGKDSAAFNPWLSKPSAKSELIVGDIGLARNIISCWSCKGYCTVCAIYARKITIDQINSQIKTGLFILTEITDMPDEMATFISLRCINFRLGKANESGERSYRNHCDHCAIGLSDLRLHKKDKGFNPSVANNCKNIQFIDLLFFDNLKIKADYLDYSEHKLLLNFSTKSDYLIDFV